MKPKAVTALALTICMAGGSVWAESLLSTGVTGTVRSSGKQNPTYVLGPLQVQQLLLEIAEEPQDRDRAAAALEGCEIGVDDLLALRLLRQEGSKLIINFNFLTQRDQAEILRVSAKHAEKLAEGFLDRRAEIEALLEGRTLATVPTSDFAYILIGCFSLDWDGLAFTDDPRYRTAATHRVGEDIYTPWAKEKGDAVPLKGLFWGSHNHYMEHVTVTTFGDHHALPRLGFPDFAWYLRFDEERLPGDNETKRLITRLARSFLRQVYGSVGDVMLNLAAGPRSAKQLGDATAIDERTLSDLMKLLEAVDYISPHENGYQAEIPVLVDADSEMVRELLTLGRKIIREWHEEYYDVLAADLGHISPVKYGVPYSVVYTEVWHYVFALANVELIEAGLMSDPYDEERRFKGFIPAVWRPGQERLDVEDGRSVPPT